MPGGLPVAGSKPGGYVPPSRRAGAGEGDSMRRREENSVRVTNLSEDTREDDLRARPRPRARAAEQGALAKPRQRGPACARTACGRASAPAWAPQVFADLVFIFCASSMASARTCLAVVCVGQPVDTGLRIYCYLRPAARGGQGAGLTRACAPGAGPVQSVWANLADLHRVRPRHGRGARLRICQLRVQPGRAARHREARRACPPIP